ncbi:MAG: DEAD/DEAH box helicase [Candidatus Hydrogenedentes bacterium]|nr:DEAD/DEAH box helicase [Candidatus Hydrogenedentota bacterium]
MKSTTAVFDRFHVPQQIRELWKEISPTLLPIQQEVISSGALFDAESLLIHAPTSSGKSFLSELAMVAEAFNGGKSIYLVPLRVQAEEIYRILKKRYEKFGLNILISTRDYRAKDSDLENGNFHIAVVVYEKMLQTCSKNPYIRSKVHRIIFDDIDLLFDFDRGGVVDFLVSLWKVSPAKKMYLSASLPRAEEVVKWLNAMYIYSEFRPVELRKGVLYDGTFHYLDKEKNKEEKEQFWRNGEGDLNPIIGSVRLFCKRGEQTLIFMKSRNEVNKLAWDLANSLSLPPAELAYERLKEIEPTHIRDFMMELLQYGVGIHHSDLLQEEREIVEESFRSGEIKVLVSTNTLAKGLNLPVDNVIISPEKCNYHRVGSSATTLLLPLNEFENMAGRAGRYALTEKPARAILIAQTEREKDLLFQWYIRQGMLVNSCYEVTNSRINEYLLSVVTSYGEISAEELEEFARSTWWGWCKNSIASEKESVEKTISLFLSKAIRKKLCVRSFSHYYSPTTIGRLISTKGISLSTFDTLYKWLKSLNSEVPTELETIFAVALTEDAYLPQFELSREEILSSVYIEMLKSRDPSLLEKVNQLYPPKKSAGDTHHIRLSKACKVSLVLERWLDGVTLRQIEDEFAVSAGQIISAGQKFAWLIDATAGIAEIAHLKIIGFLKELAERLRLGLPPDLLTLTRGHHLYLTRSMILALHKSNLDSWEKIYKAYISDLLQCVPEEIAKMLKGISEKMYSPKIKEELENFENGIKAISKALAKKNDANYCLTSDPNNKKMIEISFEVCDAPNHESTHIWKIKPDNRILLALDSKRPGEAWVEGKILRLPEKQYRLLVLLTKEVGKCVGYEEIYKELWGDIIVEDNQIAYQKCLLLRALSSISTEWKNRIRTVSKRGFILELLPEQVKINECT